MGRWFGMALVGSVCLAVGIVFGQDATRRDYQKLIESADKNKDGYVDRVEFKEQMTEAFFIIDVDKDGYLTLDEIRQTASKVDPNDVQAADRDGDGKLSIHEYREAVEKDFDEADTNDDGKLSPDEIESFLR